MSDAEGKKLAPAKDQYDLRSEKAAMSTIGFESYKNGILGGTAAAVFAYGANHYLALKNKAYAGLPKTFRFYFWSLFSFGFFFYWVEETETSRAIDTNAKFAQSMISSDEERYIKHLETKSTSTPIHQGAPKKDSV